MTDVLELDLPGESFPCRVVCPLCREPQLWLYQDSKFNEPWGHCFQCNWSGDPLELIAASWHDSPGTAWRRLSHNGLSLPPINSETIRRYLANGPQARKRRLAFWEECRHNLASTSSPEIASLRAKFRLLCYVNQRQWEDGPGRWFGMSCRHQADYFFRPSTRGQYLRGDKRVFKGHRWRDVLVVPSWWAPGYIRGFHFLGRQGEPSDKIFRTCPAAYQSNCREAGLVGLDALAAAKLFPAYVVAVDDPWLLLRMQCRHNCSSLHPLPLVAWYDSGRFRTEVAWQAVNRRRVLFICRRLTAAVLYQASLVHGHIWVLPLKPGTAGFGKFVRDIMPADLFRRAIREAKPWREALSAWIPTQQPGVPEELMLDLADYRFDVSQLARDCGLEGVAEVLEVPRVREVRLGSKRYVERPEGWFSLATRREILVSQVLIRIEQVVHTPAIEYHGHLLYRGERIPFAVSLKALRGRIARTFMELCEAQGLPRPYLASHRGNLLALAFAFYRPQIVKIPHQKPRARPETRSEGSSDKDSPSSARAS